MRTGLQTNLSKSHIIFSPNTNIKRKREIIQILQFHSMAGWWTHLGIPMNEGRIPTTGFSKLIKKIDNTLSGWQAKLLSFARKVTLIKYVICSIPNFCLVRCQEPYAIVDKIEKLIRNFLQSEDLDSKNYHLISWSQISYPKEGGGMGIYSLCDIQRALRGKLLFRLLENNSKPWVKWIFSTYNLQKDFWNHQRPSKYSPLLKEFIKVGQCLREGIFINNNSQFKCALSANNSYTTKSGLNLIRAGSLQKVLKKYYWSWKSIWKLKLIPKI